MLITYMIHLIRLSSKIQNHYITFNEVSLTYIDREISNLISQKPGTFRFKVTLIFLKLIRETGNNLLY